MPREGGYGGEKGITGTWIQEPKLLAILLHCPTEIQTPDSSTVTFMDDFYCLSFLKHKILLWLTKKQ